MSANNKFGMLLAVIVLAMYALAGCNDVVRTASAGATPYDPVLYRDTQTGCEYLATGVSRALTPRLRADGTQVCGGAK